MRVLLTATVQSHICQFHKPLVEMLHEHGCEVHVAARDNLVEKNGLKLDFVDKVFDVPFARSPKNSDNIKAYKQLKKIIDEGHYDVIHCNTPMGGVVTRLAARKAREEGAKVFYTAHGFHFYKGAPKKNWLVFFPIEKFFAERFTDKLITINNEDYSLACEEFKCKVDRIHGVGVDNKRYRPATVDEQHRLRTQEGLADDEFVILCIGELLPNKNQKVLIEAISLCKKQIPDIKLLLAGNGPEKENLQALVENFGLQQNVRFLGYRTDLERVTPCVDVVCSVSIREGLPLNIIESMLCCKPIVASENRGHFELIKDGYNGFLIASSDTIALADRLLSLYADREKSQGMGKNGLLLSIAYTSEEVKREMSLIYFERTDYME